METKQTVEIDGKRAQLDYGGAGSESPPTTGSAVNLLDETAFQRDRAEMELMAVICAVNGFCKTKPDMMITEFARIMPKVIRFARLAAEEDKAERQNKPLHPRGGATAEPRSGESDGST
jgi:hypothetical protein